MKELNLKETQAVNGGFFEVAAIIGCSVLFYYYLYIGGYVSMKNFGRW